MDGWVYMCFLFFILLAQSCQSGVKDCVDPRFRDKNSYDLRHSVWFITYCKPAQTLLLSCTNVWLSSSGLGTRKSTWLSWMTFWSTSGQGWGVSFLRSRTQRHCPTRQDLRATSTSAASFRCSTVCCGRWSRSSTRYWVFKALRCLKIRKKNTLKFTLAYMLRICAATSLPLWPLSSHDLLNDPIVGWLCWILDQRSCCHYLVQQLDSHEISEFTNSLKVGEWDSSRNVKSDIVDTVKQEEEEDSPRHTF